MYHQNMSIFSYIKSHILLVTIATVVIIGGAILLGRSGDTASQVKEIGPKKVQVANVSSFRKNDLVVQAQGMVESKSQADLKSQMSAPVSVTNVSIGDMVYAGQVILELQNADIRAQLSQAKASLDLANGQYYTGGVSLDSAKSSAIDQVRDSYLKGYEAVITNIDPLLNNNDGNGSRLTSFVSDAKTKDEIISVRIDLTNILKDWKTAVDALSPGSSPDDIIAAIRLSSKNLNTITGLLNNISRGLNDAAIYSNASFSAFLNNWKAIVSGAKASVSGSSLALSGALASLSGSNASFGTTAEAQVSLAKAGVQNLQAQLGKTIITSPITGRISALPLRVGELAAPGQLLATIIGGGGLEVKAFVSGEDIARVGVGASVIIGDTFKGTVANVAPSLNSASRKAEVDVDVTDLENSGLVVGQNVSVSITAKGSVQSPAAANTYLLPIQDVKIVPGAAYVFTVDQDSKIKRNDVTLGQVQGDFIEVVSGLSDDMQIVTPVYELDEGEKVSVQ